MICSSYALYSPIALGAPMKKANKILTMRAYRKLKINVEKVSFEKPRARPYENRTLPKSQKCLDPDC